MKILKEFRDGRIGVLLLIRTNDTRNGEHVLHIAHEALEVLSLRQGFLVRRL